MNWALYFLSFCLVRQPRTWEYKVFLNVEAFLMSNKIFRRDLWRISCGQKLTHNEDEKTTATNSALKGRIMPLNLL